MDALLTKCRSKIVTKRSASEIKTDKRYWQDFTNLQHIKHDMLRRYLGGWFPILSTWNGRIVYFETHAGRGKHDAGHEGSPIVALRTLLEHKLRNRILSNSKANFIFLEKFADSANDLQVEISNLGQLPASVSTSIVTDDYQQQLSEICDALDAGELRLAPVFMFVDPYSFLLPVEQLSRILQESKCELFINFMWRYLNLAIANETQIKNMNEMFGKGNWEDLADVSKNDERCDVALQRLKERLGAEHVWAIKMYGAKNELKYVLAHFCNHERAYRLMKDVVWSLAPHGEFRFWQSDDPMQSILIQTEPNLLPLSRMIWTKFKSQTVRVHDVYALVDPSVFKRTHYHKQLKSWISDGHCDLVDDEKKLVLKDNPRIRFVTPPQ